MTIFAVSVPIAVLMTLVIEADTVELATVEAKRQVAEDIEGSVEFSREIKAKPFNTVMGTDGDEESDETGELHVLRISAVITE